MKTTRSKMGFSIALFLIGASWASWAQTSAETGVAPSPAPLLGNLDGIVSKQRQLYELKLDSQIREESARARSMSNGKLADDADKYPGVAPSEIRVAGIYGVAENLMAQLDVRGAKITVRSGEEFEGWTVTAIDDRSISLVRTTFNTSANSSAKLASAGAAKSQRQPVTRIWLHTGRLPDSILKEASGYSSEASRLNLPPVPPGVAFPGVKSQIPAPAMPRGIAPSGGPQAPNGALNSEHPQ